MTYPVAFRKLVLQKRSQMSYRKLAALYGISVNAIRSWEQGIGPAMRRLGLTRKKRA